MQSYSSITVLAYQCSPEYNGSVLLKRGLQWFESCAYVRSACTQEHSCEFWISCFTFYGLNLISI